MAGKSRVPMQVSPIFEIRIKNLQKEIMKKQGQVISMRDLTEKITKMPKFEELEQAILNIDDVTIKINMDRRKK